MGRRRTPRTTDPSPQDEGYYKLIPRGKGFKNSGPSPKRDKSTVSSCTAQAQQWRDELLKLYGYETKRVGEKEEKLFIKAGFINNIPKETDAAKRVLKLLVCDRTTLFKDEDPFYRSNRINGPNLSTQKKFIRDYPKLRDRYVDMALCSYSSNPSSGARILLNEIVKEAAKKHMSVHDWLFSKKHIKKSRTKNTEETNCIWDSDKLDIECCREDCEQLLVRCGENQNIIENIDFEWFIISAVKSYINEERKLKIIPPEASSYRDESMDYETVPKFKERLKQLEDLEEKFNAKIRPVEPLRRMNYWGKLNQEADEQTEQYVSSVCLIILRFLCAMGVTVKDNKSDNSSYGHVSNELSPTSAVADKETDVENGGRTSCKRIEPSCFDYLKGRVRWSISVKLLKKNPYALRPIFLLNMVMACKHQMFEDPVDDTIQPCEILTKRPMFFPRISKPKQRYIQLMFLSELRKIFRISNEDWYTNLREYICLYGGTILSQNELKFWNRYLAKNYELIPQIGFQLCFHKHCMQCIPLYPAHLNYRPCSKLHLGGYYEFCLKIEKKLQTVSKELCQQHKKEVSQYKVAWNKPEFRGAKLENLLLQLAKQIPLNLSDFTDSDNPDYDQEELKLLVLETVLQLQIRRDAISVLLEGFSRVYRVPLVSACRTCLKPTVTDNTNKRVDTVY